LGLIVSSLAPNPFGFSTRESDKRMKQGSILATIGLFGLLSQ
jgi:hypothetical protein